MKQFKNKHTINLMQAGKLCTFLYSCFMLAFIASAQIPPGSKVVYATIFEGDTIPMFETKPVLIISYRQLLTEEEIRKNGKLIRNVKKVYPLARLAQTKLSHYNTLLTQSKNEKERKDIMKKAENDIEKEFGKDLKKLSFSQGAVLIKLVDRETGSSSYELVAELRGKFRAFFYQTFAKVFGYNLKARFDPRNNKEDELIDRIVRAIDQNQI